MSNDGPKRKNGYGSVFRLGDTDKYRAQVTRYDPMGRPVQRTKTYGGPNAQRQAERGLVELEDLYPVGVPITPPPSKGGTVSGTVGALLDEWLTEKARTRSGNTVSNYRNIINAHLTPAFGHLMVKDLTAVQVNNLILNLTSRHFAEPRPLSTRTKKLVRNVLCMALDHGVKYHGLPENVARNSEVPEKSNAEKRKEPRWFDDDETRRFLAVAQHDRLYAAWAVQLQVGLRPGETRALAYEDIDFKKKIMHVRHGQQRSDGELVRGATQRMIIRHGT